MRFISWSHSHHSNSFLNFFLLNKYVNSCMYLGKSFGFVASGSLLILPLSCSLLPVVYILLVLNSISWCFILQLPEHLVNCIILFFQLTSGLCLTNQLCPKNMSIPFKSVTTASSYSLCPLILIYRGTILVTSLFFVLSMLKTSNEKFIGFVCILLSLTSCSLILVCVHPKSTSAFTLRFLLFFIFTFSYIFNSISTLLCWFWITYLFWEFIEEISCIVLTQDLLQNSISCSSLYYLYYLISLKSSISSLIAFLYNWSTSAFHLWNCYCSFQCPWAVLTFYMLFPFLSCNRVILL